MQGHSRLHMSSLNACRGCRRPPRRSWPFSGEPSPASPWRPFCTRWCHPQPSGKLPGTGAQPGQAARAASRPNSVLPPQNQRVHRNAAAALRRPADFAAARPSQPAAALLSPPHLAGSGTPTSCCRPLCVRCSRRALSLRRRRCSVRGDAAGQRAPRMRCCPGSAGPSARRRPPPKAAAAPLCRLRPPGGRSCSRRLRDAPHPPRR